MFQFCTKNENSLKSVISVTCSYSLKMAPLICFDWVDVFYALGYLPRSFGEPMKEA
jgi:hypothetical protein